MTRHAHGGSAAKPDLGLFLLAALLGLSFLDWSTISAAILLVACAAVFIAVNCSARQPVPSVALVALAYVLGYAFLVLFNQESLRGIQPAALASAMQWAARGFAAFTLAYTITARVARRHTHARSTTASQCSYARFCLRIIAVLSILAWALKTARYGLSFVFIEGQVQAANSQTVLQILSLFIDFRFGFLLGYLLMRNARQARFVDHILFFSVLGLLLVDIVAVGSKGTVITLLVVLVMPTLLGARGKLKWQTVLGGLLAVALVILTFSVITEYRAILLNANRSGQSNMSLDFRAEVFSTSVLRALPGGGSPQMSDVDANTITSRMGSGAFSLGWILQVTNGNPPYENPVNSALAPLYAFAPRSLFPNKPVFYNSGQFAHDYFGWAYGGISLSLLGSLYWAWGYIGILIGMALAGIGLALLTIRVEERGFVALNSMVCFALLFVGLLAVGREFQPLLVTITRAFVVLVGIRIAWRVSVRFRASLRDVASAGLNHPARFTVDDETVVRPGHGR